MDTRGEDLSETIQRWRLREVAEIQILALLFRFGGSMGVKLGIYDKGARVPLFGWIRRRGDEVRLAASKAAELSVWIWIWLPREILRLDILRLIFCIHTYQEI